MLPVGVNCDSDNNVVRLSGFSVILNQYESGITLWATTESATTESKTDNSFFIRLDSLDFFILAVLRSYCCFDL